MDGIIWTQISSTLVHQANDHQTIGSNLKQEQTFFLFFRYCRHLLMHCPKKFIYAFQVVHDQKIMKCILLGREFHYMYQNWRTIIQSLFSQTSLYGRRPSSKEPLQKETLFGGSFIEGTPIEGYLVDNSPISRSPIEGTLYRRIY